MNFDADLEKSFLSSKINFKNKNLKKIFCKTILLAVRRQSVKMANICLQTFYFVLHDSNYTQPVRI